MRLTASARRRKVGLMYRSWGFKVVSGCHTVQLRVAAAGVWWTPEPGHYSLHRSWLLSIREIMARLPVPSQRCALGAARPGRPLNVKRAQPSA